MNTKEKNKEKLNEYMTLLGAMKYGLVEPPSFSERGDMMLAMIDVAFGENGAIADLRSEA